MTFVRRTGRDLTASVNGERVKTPFNPLVVVPGPTTGSQTVITHPQMTVASAPGAPPTPKFFATAGEAGRLSITLYPIPYTLYPIPYTLYPISHTLYPIPYNPIPQALDER
jgi:hypothetical protein